MQKKYKRLCRYGGLLFVVGFGVWLVLYALRDNVVFYVTPSEFLLKKEAGTLRLPVRLGGRIKQDTLKKSWDSYSFQIEDQHFTIGIHFTGIVPELFKEGQTIVVHVVDLYMPGQNIYKADEVLAKHDENYQPPPFRQKK